MGSDGAVELLKIRKSGNPKIAQNEDSSIVYRMQKAAVELGATDFIAGRNSILEVLASFK